MPQQELAVEQEARVDLAPLSLEEQEAEAATEMVPQILDLAEEHLALMQQAHKDLMPQQQVEQATLESLEMPELEAQEEQQPELEVRESLTAEAVEELKTLITTIWLVETEQQAMPLSTNHHQYSYYA
jgi:hypothetical protein